MGVNEGEEARSFLVVTTDGTRGNRHKLEHMIFQLHTRKQFFTIRVVKIWHRLPKEVFESPSLETWLDMVLGNLLLGDPV